MTKEDGGSDGYHQRVAHDAYRCEGSAAVLSSRSLFFGVSRIPTGTGRLVFGIIGTSTRTHSQAQECGATPRTEIVVAGGNKSRRPKGDAEAHVEAASLHRACKAVIM